MNKTKFLLASLLLAVTAVPALAQTGLSGNNGVLLPKQSAKEKAARQLKAEARYPLVTQRKTLTTKPSPFKAVGPNGLILPHVPYNAVPSAAPVRRLAVPGAASEIWGTMIYNTGWFVDHKYYDHTGLYSITPGQPVALDSIYLNPYMAFSGGAAIVDGVYYQLIADLSNISYGLAYARLLSYNISDWTPTETSGDSIGDYSLIAFQTAQAQDGTVYGEFYTADLQGHELGIINYKTLSRSTIGTLNHTYVAMGVTSDNRLYGIGTDANLYKIDTGNAMETLVGPTGVTGVTDMSGYYGQSGVIDPKTNTFYWAEIGASGYEGGFYSVDLNTGHATRIGDYDGGLAEIYNMLVPTSLAVPSAPGKASSFAVSFPEGNTDGTATFTAPATAYDGKTLSGALGFTIRVDNQEYSVGTVEPGGTLSVPVDATEGSHQFSVTFSNDAGNGPTSLTNYYVGYDNPKAPQNVTLTSDTAGTTATLHLSWTAPDGGQHKGYVGPLTYDVFRIIGNDTTQVATGLTGTSFSEDVTIGKLTNYFYAVRANNNSRPGALALSNGQVVGIAFEVPYYEDFNRESDMGLYTFIDANHDADGDYGHWIWGLQGENGFLSYCYSNTNKADDWAITPPIHLTTGRTYKVAFLTRAQARIYPERLEVKWGSAPTVAGMTNTLVEPTDISSMDLTEMSNQINVDADGYYYIGFHAISEPARFFLWIDSVTVTANALSSAPDSVKGLKVTPDATGKLKASISFTAPTLDVEGNALSSLDSIAVRSGKRIVTTLRSVAPGTQYTVEDDSCTNGVNNYIVTPYNAAGNGRDAVGSAFVGIDVPQTPANPKAKDNATSVAFSWDPTPSKGPNGGYVNPAGVTTFLYDIDYYGETSDDPVAYVTGNNTMSLSLNTNVGTPDLKEWALINANTAGQSGLTGISIPVGEPYNVPFKETLAKNTLSYSWWLNNYNGTGWTWNVDESVDANGGSFVYRPEAGHRSSINTYKIRLSRAANPKLVFFNKFDEGAKGTFGVDVYTASGDSTRIYSQTFDGQQGWKSHQVDLSQFKSQQWIYVKFDVRSEGTGAIGLDKIIMGDLTANDLSVGITIPQKVKKGQTISAAVKITNEGSQDASAYTLTVKKDGRTVGSPIAVSKPLPSFSDTTINVQIPTSTVTDHRDQLSINATVDYALDANLDDNVVDTTIEATSVDLPAPRDPALNGTNLTWLAPAHSGVETTEDFESYAQWQLPPIGDWTIVNGNNGRAGSFTGLNFPIAGEAFGYAVFHFDSSMPPLQPHAGDNFLGAAYSTDADGNDINSDEWLISPQLSGESQTISFWAHNIRVTQGGTVYNFPEQFEVMSSATSTDISAFKRVGGLRTVSSGEWTEFTADMPEGTQYFAIHHVTDKDNAYMFGLDDFTFRVGAPAPVGYNIYRDRVLVATVTADVLNWLDNNGGTHFYQITAVYADGSESAPVSTGTDAISNIKSENNTDELPAYNVAGQRVGNSYRGIVVKKGSKRVQK